ncbi:hypothetical protein JXA02_11620, partial [candidate division KSB1 bacterium]
MKKALCMLSIFSILFCALCSKQEPAPVRSQFHPKISAFTTGQVSCLAPIRIVLTDQIIQAEQIGAAIEPSPFSFKPKIKGVAVWANDRTVEFRPTERLPQAQQFEATFNLRDIMIVEKGQERFAFSFTTVKQSIDLRLDGLSYEDSDHMNRQRLTGVIELADEQDISDVENILSAKKDGKTFAITWLEQQDNRKFRFAVTAIIREEKTSQLTLKWDGSPIGVDDKGEIEIEIPGLETFSILNGRAVRDDREYVELRFSDPIKPKQELNGLITIENHPNTHFAITENVIAVYSSSPFVGDVQVTVSPGISNVMGRKITAESRLTVTFEEFKPQVRFVGDGAILPTSHGLTIPIEAVNLRAITVSAMLINDQKIPQFLQVNDLKGDQELERVGQIVWRNIVNLDPTPNRLNQWIRYGLDISPLVAKNSGGLFRISLSFQRQHIACQCPETEESAENAIAVDPWDEDVLQERRYYYGENYDEYWTNRKNPCHPAYYLQWYDHDIQATQNFIISDLALIAKRGGNDSLFVAVTDIKSTQPMANVSLKVLDFQQNIVGSGSTNGDGIAIIKTSKRPFLLIARTQSQSGYLKLNDGSSLSLSHFDVSGETVNRGLRGYIYGERGVWRPGDPIYLTFILLNDGKLPTRHPVRFELYNPRGQLVETLTVTSSMNGFYTFQTKTQANAPTGDWLATVQVGGVTFSKSLKIETVMPNRLKITLDMHGKEELDAGDISGTLSAAWLHGATASNLDADIELKLAPMQTTWPNFADYSFDDPAITFEFESQQVFKGALNEKGVTTFSKRVAPTEAPGKLQARFTTRVFEPGGAFSTDYFNLPFHPFRHYVGLLLPDAGDPDRIQSDSTVTIRVVRVTA